ARLRQDPRFGTPALQVAQSGDVALVNVPVRGDEVGGRAIGAVRDLKNNVLPQLVGPGAEVHVGGITEENAEYFNAVPNPALIIVVVFLGFAAGELVMFQQMGFGIAVALLLDATVIRSVVLPSMMTLLGERTWYLPSWLEWLPHVEVERPAQAAAGA